jgi:hypothetical protein
MFNFAGGDCLLSKSMIIIILKLVLDIFVINSSNKIEPV